jgi:hypothetical protein
MYELLIAFIVILFAILQAREHFGLVVGGKEVGYVSTDTKTDKGYEIFSTYPNTCPPDKNDLDAGLCYPRCKSGFHGVGPVCWADTVSVGVGIPVGLNPCPPGWNNDGLICREPIWNDCSWKALGVCWGKLRGGRLRGRLNPYCPEKRRRGGDGFDTADDQCVQNPKFPNSPRFEKTMGVCEGAGALSDDHPDYIAGLCYKSCPKNLPKHLPGMPYLCYKGDGLSYGRGVGKVPSILRLGRVANPF